MVKGSKTVVKAAAKLVHASSRIVCLGVTHKIYLAPMLEDQLVPDPKEESRTSSTLVTIRVGTIEHSSRKIFPGSHMGFSAKSWSKQSTFFLFQVQPYALYIFEYRMGRGRSHNCSKTI